MQEYYGFLVMPGGLVQSGHSLWLILSCLAVYSKVVIAYGFGLALVPLGEYDSAGVEEGGKEKKKIEGLWLQYDTTN